MVYNYSIEGNGFQTGAAERANPAAYHVALEIFNHQLAQASSDTRAFLNGSTSAEAQPFVAAVNRDLKLFAAQDSYYGQDHCNSNYLDIKPLSGHPESEEIVMRNSDGKHSKRVMDVAVENQWNQESLNQQPWNSQPWNSQPWNERFCPPFNRVPPNLVYGQNGDMQAPCYYGQPRYDYNFPQVGYNSGFYYPPTQPQWAPVYETPMYAAPVYRDYGWCRPRQENPWNVVAAVATHDITRSLLRGIRL